MARTPTLRVAVVATVPTNLDQLGEIVDGLMVLASAHDVPHEKVRVRVVDYGGSTQDLEANWSTPAAV